MFRLLTDGDRFALTATGNPNLRNYRQLGASYALPIGSDGLTLTGNAIWLETRPPELDVEGTAKLGSLTALYPLLRTFRSAADLTFGIDAIDSSNAALGNIIVTEKTRAARLAGSFVAASEAHNFSATGTLSQGLDILGGNIRLYFIHARARNARNRAATIFAAWKSDLRAGSRVSPITNGVWDHYAHARA